MILIIINGIIFLKPAMKTSKISKRTAEVARENETNKILLGKHLEMKPLSSSFGRKMYFGKRLMKIFLKSIEHVGIRKKRKYIEKGFPRFTRPKIDIWKRVSFVKPVYM